MDHIPRLANPASSDIEVLYPSKLEYDGGDFLTYPFRMGWKKTLLLQGIFTEKPLSATASMLQTWLYFGLLHEVLSIPLPPTEFLRPAPLGQIITTTCLPYYMVRWKVRIRELSSEEQIGELRSIDACLGDTSLILKYANHQPSWIRERLLPDPVLLCIAILGSSLDFLRWSTIRELEISDDQLTAQHFWTGSKLLGSRMESQGWCKSDIAAFKVGSHISAMYFASTLHRTQLTVNKTHALCSEEDCIANDINEQTYHSQHTTITCRCRSLEPPNAEIHRILDQGGIPVIRLRSALYSTKPEIAVVDSKDVAYVAISHVWSDGLGNGVGNWLYGCQLLRLYDLVNDLWHIPSLSFTPLNQRDPVLSSDGESEKVVAFWIDTICVPLQRRLRNIAISRMKETYQEAGAVLVLDSELQLQSHLLSKEEIVLRISFSCWMRRFWTLQEGILAKRLFFQMHDGVIQFSSLRNLAVEAIKSAEPRSLLLLECSSRLSQIYLYKNTQDCKRIMWAWNAFQQRRTSRQGDAYIIFGTLLGLATEELPTISGERRMIKLLSQLSEFPQEILFALGKRIRKTGYRWALDLPPRSPLINSTTGFRDQLGLKVRLPGFSIGQLKAKPDQIFYLTDKNDRRYYVINCGLDRYKDLSWDDVRFDTRDSYGLILQQHPYKLVSNLQTAVLVTIKQDDEYHGILYAEFLCQISIGYMSQDTFQSIPSTEHIGPNLVSARRLSCDQEWCVS